MSSYWPTGALLVTTAILLRVFITNEAGAGTLDDVLKSESMTINSSNPRLHDNWLFRLRNSPKQFEFVQTIRILSDSPIFKNKLSLVPYSLGEYLRSEISGLEQADDRFKLTVSKPALTGTHGVLPHTLRDTIRKVIYEKQ